MRDELGVVYRDEAFAELLTQLSRPKWMSIKQMIPKKVVSGTLEALLRKKLPKHLIEPKADPANPNFGRL